VVGKPEGVYGVWWGNLKLYMGMVGKPEVVYGVWWGNLKVHMGYDGET